MQGQSLRRSVVASIISFVSLIAMCHTLNVEVRDAVTREPVEFATVRLNGGSQVQQTDAQGMCRFAVTSGNCNITVSFVGYVTQSLSVMVKESKSVSVLLAEDSQVLGEVVVTAKESTGLTSSSRIDREAMMHLQPTSFTDLLELLPGNISQTPTMGSVNAITLRETGTMGATGTKTDNPDYNITSLGTLFMVDGAPVNGDANLQGVPSAASDASSPEFKRDMTNKGVDMRTLSTDNIESVEIIRGIPSAEYGNLTSGMVNIKRIRKVMPLTARFKADEYSKLVSVAKGFNLGRTSHIMNIDGGYLDSKVDPRNNLENYKRVNLSTRFNFQFNRPAFETSWIAGVDYTGSFDNAKTDPDLSYMKVNEYKSRYNRWNVTSNLTFSLSQKPWLRLINLNTSVSYHNDRLERRKQVAPQRASVAPTSLDEGVHDGQYLLGEYIADYVSDGKPMNVFVKLKGEGSLRIGKVENSYKAGAEWTVSKNYGDGQVYDLTRPLSASWTTRPRAFKDIPALSVLSTYIEDNITAPIASSRLELQLGLRTIQLLNLDSRYAMHRKVYPDPRLNAKWTMPDVQVGKRVLKWFVAGGFGLTTKMPTIDYLYPQVHYNDFIQLNYYDILLPAEHSRINLRTYIDPTVNYQLKPAVNHKWELRLGASIGKNKLSVTYFQERMRSGFRYSTFYAPYEYRLYDASGVVADMLTAPPTLEELPYADVRELDGYSRVDNGSRIDKQGIEFVANTARWQPLATALNVTGAWFRTTYTNSRMLYQTVNDVVGNEAVSHRYVGYYDCNDGRVNEQFNTNFMFDTQITRWGLVFTTSIQCMWYVSSKKMWQNGMPQSYLDVADGLLHPYTEESLNDPILQFLVKTFNDDTYKRQTTPIAMYVNLKATKQIGKHLKIAVFANRLLDYLPDYKSNGLMVRRITDPYFGMELNFSL